MNLLEVFRGEHEKLRGELAAIESAAPGPEEARRAFARHLREHAETEDRILFAQLENVLPAGAGPLEVMRKEHAEIDIRVGRLADDAGDEGNRRALQALVREHFAKEEEVLFEFAARLLDPETLEALGANLARQREAPEATITPEMRVAEIARRHPATTAVFERFGMDFCCGGNRPLSEAAARHGVALLALLAELSASASDHRGEATDWAARAPEKLADYVLARFHAGLRTELSRLAAMAERTRERHGSGHPELAKVARVTAQLARAMAAHLDLEEAEIFPAVVRGENPPDGLLDRAGEEHAEVGRALETLRGLTRGFEAPEEACNTWRGLLHGLERLERETHEHVHLENNVLFPALRSRELERARVARA